MPNQKSIWFIVSSGLFIALFFYFLNQNLAWLPITLATLLFAYLALSRPFILLITIILTRPLLDMFSGVTIIDNLGLKLNMAGIFALLILSVSLFIIKNNRKLFYTIKFKSLWLVFLAITFLSITWSISPTTSMGEWLRLLSIFAMFSLGYIITKSREDLEKIITAVSLSALIPSLFAIYQFITETGLTLPFEGINNRIYGTFAHPNVYAYYLVLAITLVFYKLVKTKREPINNLPYLLLGSFYLIMLILTFTRGSWLALVIVMAIISLNRFPKLLLVGGILALIIGATIVPIRDRILNAFYTSDNSISWRQQLWKDELTYAKERPILGIGAGTAHDFILDKRGYKQGSPDTHNDYLKILLENGYVGLISYALLQLSLLFYFIKQYQTTDKKHSLIYLIFTSLIISLLLVSNIDNFIKNTVLQWSFWTLIGASLAVSKK